MTRAGGEDPPRLPWCLDCRYDLSGLALRDRAVVCPECGRINRIAELRRQLTLPPFARDFALMVAPATGLALVAAAAAAFDAGIGLIAAAGATAALLAVGVPPIVMVRRRARFPLRGLTILDEIITGMVAAIVLVAGIVLTAAALVYR